MNSARDSLRLGTRNSLLALAQSRLVANALHREHPELQVSLVPVETRGDRDQRECRPDGEVRLPESPRHAGSGEGGLPPRGG